MQAGFRNTRAVVTNILQELRKTTSELQSTKEELNNSNMLLQSITEQLKDTEMKLQNTQKKLKENNEKRTEAYIQLEVHSSTELKSVKENALLLIQKMEWEEERQNELILEQSKLAEHIKNSLKDSKTVTKNCFLV